MATFIGLFSAASKTIANASVAHGANFAVGDIIYVRGGE